MVEITIGIGKPMTDRHVLFERFPSVVACVIIAHWLAHGDVPRCSADEPIATIAVVSNPYVTTLPADQIKDETGRPRDFLAKTVPTSLEKTIALVNTLRPDAFVVLGSLTWQGTANDFSAMRNYLKRVEVPTYVTPGHRDRLSEAMPDFRRVFAKYNAENTVKLVNGIALAFAGDLDREPAVATQRLKEQLTANAASQGVLLFSGLDRSVPRSKLTSTDTEFWQLVEQSKIAVRIDPTRYDHQLGYTNTLPVWSVGSTGWSARGTVTLVRVFADRIEMAEIADPSSPAFSLTIPNPVQSPRMVAVADDPFGCPSYSADLALKPNFSFALVSDPQFDRAANREFLIEKAASAIEELNRLKPAMVLIAGDLVNNNLPEEWELFNRQFAKLNPPKHVVPGNHDVLFNYDFVEKSYAAAPQQKPEYAALVKQALIAAEKEGFTGSTALYEKYIGAKPRQFIEHRDCAFITVPFLTTRADMEQLAFLRENLAKTDGKKHVFVIAHYPTLPIFGNNLQPRQGGDEVLSLLNEHRVTGYLFGHRHRNGFRLHDRTAHILTDNMGTIHLLHVFDEEVIVGRKRVGSPLYEKLTIPSPRG